MRRSRQLVIEVRSGWVVILQPGVGHVVLSPEELARSSGELPSPDQIREQMAAAGMSAAPVCLLIPRVEAMVGLEHLPFKAHRQAYNAASLEVAASASLWDEPTLQAVAIRHVHSRSGNSTTACWFAVPTARVEFYRQWLQSCGLELDEVRVSTLESTHGSDQQSNDSSVGVVAVLCYPVGGWDVVWLSGREQGSHYTLPEPSFAHLADCLGTMLLRHLSKSSLDDMTDASEPLELTGPVRLRVLIQSGDFDTERQVRAYLGSLQQNEWTQLVTQVTVESSPGWDGWPQVALMGTTQRNRKQALPILRFEQPRQLSQKWRQYASFLPLLLVLTFTLLTTMGAYLYAQSASRHLMSVREQIRAAVGLNPESTVNQDAVAQLETKVRDIQSYVDQGSRLLENLALLNQVAQPDWQIEQLSVQNQQVRVTLNTTSGTGALEGLANSPHFSDVQLVGEITVTEIQGKRVDHMTVRLVPAH